MQADELMTKNILRKFKNKHANDNITELFTTEEWDDPVLGDATSLTRQR